MVALIPACYLPNITSPADDASPSENAIQTIAELAQGASELLLELLPHGANPNTTTPSAFAEGVAVSGSTTKERS